MSDLKISPNASAVPAMTTGSVVFGGAVGQLQQDNVNLFWDDTNNRLGIGTASPAYTLDTGTNGGKINDLRFGITNGSNTIGTSSGNDVVFDRNIKATIDDNFNLGHVDTRWKLGYFSQKINLLDSGQTGTNDINLGGNIARKIWLERHTTANTAGNNLTIQAGGATSAATDKNGGDHVIASGTATGTGSSNILLQTATPGTTGTADNAPSTKVTISGNGNVGIGVTANANAILDVSSTTKAFMPPRMTTTQRDAIASPTAGMIIYNSTTNKLNIYTTAWEVITSA